MVIVLFRKKEYAVDLLKRKKKKRRKNKNLQN